MKFLRNFETMAAYSAATINRPGVSLIDEDFKIIYDPKAYELNPRYLYSDMTTSLDYNSEKTLIGIEVVPASHTADRKTRFMSVRNMSLADPENGTLVTGNSEDNPGAGIRWGASGDIAGLDNQVPSKPLNVDANGDLLFELNTAEDAYGVYIPSYIDIEAIIASGMMPEEEIMAAIGTYPFYPDKYYVKAEGNNIILPYPFTATGSREDLFAQAGTVMADMDGVGNTARIIAAAINTETTGAITNNSSEGYYPAAMACHRYRGGNVEGWYLPSLGELVYVWANLYNINKKLEAAGNSVAVEVGDILTSETEGLGNWLWSSSVYSSDGAWYLAPSGGSVHHTYRYSDDTGSRVRAFLSLDI